MSSGHHVPAGLNALTNHLPAGFQTGRSDGLAQAVDGCVRRKEVSHVNR
jgi:hypothetical protein